MTVLAHSKIAREQIDAQIAFLLFRTVTTDTMRFEKTLERLFRKNRCYYAEECKNDEASSAHGPDQNVQVGRFHLCKDFVLSHALKSVHFINK